MLNKLEMDGSAVNADRQTDLNFPDPDDELFLAVALAGSADFLVTGNLSDYPSEKWQGCPVVSPTEFVRHRKKLHVRTMLVSGGRDLEAGAVSVRLHHGGPQAAKPKGEVFADILAAVRD